MIGEEFKAHFWQQPPEAFQGKLPFIVTDLIQQILKKNGENIEGIFRLNGSDSKTKILIEHLDNGPIKDWSQFEDIHTISTALKRYFRQLSKQEPLMPFRLYDQCIEASKCNINESISKFIHITKQMDLPRYYLLSYLLRFLSYIASKSSKNLMNPKNLSVCFGPNIVCSDQPDSAYAMQQSFYSNLSLEILIEHYKSIFNENDLTEDLICNQDDIQAFSVPPLKWSHVVHLIARNKSRLQYGTIPYIPQATMQISLISQRPKYLPPPINDEDFNLIIRDKINQPNIEISNLLNNDDEIFIPPPSMTIKRAGKKSVRPPTRPK